MNATSLRSYLNGLVLKLTGRLQVARAVETLVTKLELPETYFFQSGIRIVSQLSLRIMQHLT